MGMYKELYAKLRDYPDPDPMLERLLLDVCFGNIRDWDPKWHGLRLHPLMNLQDAMILIVSIVPDGWTHILEQAVKRIRNQYAGPIYPLMHLPTAIMLELMLCARGRLQEQD